MKLSNKQKQIFSTVSTLMILWGALLIVKSGSHQEYALVVDSISATPLLGKCSIRTDVESGLPFSWAPSNMTVLVTKENQDLSIYTSRYAALPDRNQLSPGFYRYHFRWSKRVRDILEVSYMEVDIDRTDKVQQLVLSVCSNYPESKYNWTDLQKEECLVDVEVIECP